MKTAIAVLKAKLDRTQSEIVENDGSIAFYRSEIDSRKVRLIELYADRDELASAIAKLGSDQ